MLIFNWITLKKNSTGLHVLTLCLKCQDVIHIPLRKQTVQSLVEELPENSAITQFQTLNIYSLCLFISEYVYSSTSTWTMAARNRTPLRPTATEAADITMGPQINRIAIPIVALFFPHAIIRGWRAMNNPAILRMRHFHCGFNRKIFPKFINLYRRT